MYKLAIMKYKPVLLNWQLDLLNNLTFDLHDNFFRKLKRDFQIDNFSIKNAIFIAARKIIL